MEAGYFAEGFSVLYVDLMFLLIFFKDKNLFEIEYSDSPTITSQ